MAGEMNQAVVEEGPGTETAERVNFKMVTFSLAGKDYGIDIMKVKEIAKFAAFTYVPNTMPFVRGVYNLRGDIISVIDLRTFFHLEIDAKKRDGVEEGLILRLEENVLGVIVDSIDKVVGLSSAEIQPPHPIFGDVNVKYIRGVVEHQSRLYVILDAEKIFGKGTQASAVEAEQVDSTLSSPSVSEPPLAANDPIREFIPQTLATFRNFHVSDMNLEWMDQRYGEWKAGRADAQLKSPEDADAFLEGFLSPCTGALWDDGLADELGAILPQPTGRFYQIWNPGCGSGRETYSVAAVVVRKYPDAAVKIWANDSDLLSISSAPTLAIRDESVPAYLAPFTTRGKTGLTFVPSIREIIYFEYHDVTNANQFPDLDLVVARDLLSFLKVSEQHRLVEELRERLKPGAVLVLGLHEKPIDISGWDRLEGKRISAFRKSRD